MAILTRHNGELIEITISGSTTDQELMQLAAEVEAIEAKLPITPDRITDMSRLTENPVRFDGIYDLAARRRSSKLKNAVRSAIIADTDVQYGMARMFQSMNDHPQITIRLFRDVTSATSWLQGGPDPLVAQLGQLSAAQV